MPSQTVDDSLFTEGSEGVRVLATRFRTRAVKNDTREEVRTREEALKKLEAEADRLQKEAAVQGQGLEYLKKLEGFTGASLTALKIIFLPFSGPARHCQVYQCGLRYTCS